MALTIDEKYVGDGDSKQRILIKDVHIWWKAVRTDPNRHLALGVTQYDYSESLESKMRGQAKRVPDKVLDSWDHNNEENPHYEYVVTREVARDVWCSFYKRKEILYLRQSMPTT